MCRASANPHLWKTFGHKIRMFAPADSYPVFSHDMTNSELHFFFFSFFLYLAEKKNQILVTVRAERSRKCWKNWLDTDKYEEFS